MCPGAEQRPLSLPSGHGPQSRLPAGLVSRALIAAALFAVAVVPGWTLGDLVEHWTGWGLLDWLVTCGWTAVGGTRARPRSARTGARDALLGLVPLYGWYLTRACCPGGWRCCRTGTGSRAPTSCGGPAGSPATWSATGGPIRRRPTGQPAGSDPGQAQQPVPGPGEHPAGALGRPVRRPVVLGAVQRGQQRRDHLALAADHRPCAPARSSSQPGRAPPSPWPARRPGRPARRTPRR